MNRTIKENLGFMTEFAAYLTIAALIVMNL